jgi:hypothetical protein
MNYTKLKKEIEREIQRDEEAELNTSYYEQMKELGIEVMK